MKADFEEETPTPVWSASMQQIMLSLAQEIEEENVSVRSPGIPTATSDRPTRPMRPLVISNMEDK